MIKRMRENNAIRALGKTVLYRIALFVLVYRSLVAFGLTLLYIGYKWATFWGNVPSMAPTADLSC